MHRRILDDMSTVEVRNIHANRPYNVVELFAGAGGLALGLEKAGFNEVALVEIDKNACDTLRTNRPNWNVIEEDVVATLCAMKYFLPHSEGGTNIILPVIIQTGEL